MVTRVEVERSDPSELIGVGTVIFTDLIHSPGS